MALVVVFGGSSSSSTGGGGTGGCGSLRAVYYVRFLTTCGWYVAVRPSTWSIGSSCFWRKWPVAT